MTAATLPLGTELVVHCAVCGEPSSASIHGAAGWKLVRRRRRRMSLVDVCPPCAPYAEALQ